jgi:hypothetical protein
MIKPRGPTFLKNDFSASVNSVEEKPNMTGRLIFLLALT